VNYFLFKFLKNYLQKIFFCLKLKTIKVQSSEIDLIYNFYLFSYYENKSENFIYLLNHFSSAKDVLVIGNTCKFLRKYLENKKKEKYFFYSYLKLLENQFLSQKLIF